MAKIVYNGGFDVVDVPAYSLEGIARGEEIEIADTEAHAICANSDWSIVPPKAPASPAVISTPKAAS